MARVFSRGLGTLFLAVSVTICAGCATSAPSRFYQLGSLKAESTAGKDSPHEQRIVVAIGPIRIPDYLDRPQIVTRSSRNELRLAEFDRWAGSIEKDIVRVLAEDISALLPEDRFFVTPWVSASQSVHPSPYRVEVNIARFEGAPGGSVLLKAQWSVFHREKGLLMSKESTVNQEVHGTTYEAFVIALSNALAGLSRDIQEALISL
ncbi:MAG: PqiC family protein [Nitrospirae bacterium]|nr:PqiC family protein [Nitrospirota bacterium]